MDSLPRSETGPLPVAVLKGPPVISKWPDAPRPPALGWDALLSQGSL